MIEAISVGIWQKGAVSARWHGLGRACVHGLAAVSTRFCRANVHQLVPMTNVSL